MREVAEVGDDLLDPEQAASRAIEKVVEAKLVVKPGFSGVTVASSGNGVIILNGTVASQAEKDQAEQVAKGTDGVKQVQNNLTIAGK